MPDFEVTGESAVNARLKNVAMSVALAQELGGLPSFRKYSGYGEFTEGWALYAEQLAKEMGFYVDPYHDFERLQNELWRSVRLVLDTGNHAKQWTREEAIA